MTFREFASLVIGALSIALVASAFPVEARAQGGYPGAGGSWWSRQYAPDGQWCCNGADGHEYRGAYEFMPDGSVQITADSGAEISIPADKIVQYDPHDPIPTADPAWWYQGDTQTDLERFEDDPPYCADCVSYSLA